MMLQLPEVLTTLTPWSVALRILLALLIGGCIGSERGRHGRAAGLRTHILVCLGSTMTTLIGLYSTNMLGSVGDPMRIGAQVVSGISFLGVGTIMVRNRSHVTGLTTAAGLWATACIGLGVGAGFYWAALLATIAVLLTFTLLARLEHQRIRRDRGAYYVEMTDIRKARAFYEELAPYIAEVEIVPAKSGLPEHVGMEVITSTKANSQLIAERLQTSEEVAIALPLH